MQCLQPETGAPFWSQLQQQPGNSAAANLAAASTVLAGQRAEDMRIMQEMKAQMGILMEMSARQAEQNKGLQVQMEEQAKFLSATMQAVRQVQSQVTAMRNEFIDVFRGHSATAFESQPQRRHLEARRGDSSQPEGTGSSTLSVSRVPERARGPNSPVIPEVGEKVLSPPASPPMVGMHQPPPAAGPSTAIGGLGVFAEQAQPASHHSFRSPPGLAFLPQEG